MSLNYTIIPVTPYQQNCTLLTCDVTRNAVLIDPGGEVDRLLNTVQKHAVTLQAIWVTHGHLDHAGGVAELAERMSLPVIGPHKDDAFWIDALPEQCKLFGFPHSESFIPSRWLEDGDSVTVGNEELVAIHCPGHTPGHIVFFSASARLAIVGDVLFKGSIGRTDFPRGDYQTLIDSIQHKLWPLGQDVSFIPGHGPMSTFKDEMDDNPFVAIRRRDRQ